MKKVMLFKLRYCGFCRQALSYVDEIVKNCPEYANLEIELIDEGEERSRARAYDYYYVPTFYIDSVKVHEGPVSKQQVEAILKQAYESN